MRARARSSPHATPPPRSSCSLAAPGASRRRRWRRRGARRAAGTPLGWVPLGGFRTLEWRAPFPKRVEAALRAPRQAGGLGLGEAQVRIVKTCLKSLATSKE